MSRPARRRSSCSSTISRPSSLPTAVISCSKNFGPSRSASSTDAKRGPSKCGGSGIGVDRYRLADRGLERAPDQHRGAQRRELRGVRAAHGGAADGEGLEQRILAPGDGGDVEDRIGLDAAVVAEELAIGAFRLL